MHICIPALELKMNQGPVFQKKLCVFVSKRIPPKACLTVIIFHFGYISMHFDTYDALNIYEGILGTML